MTVCFTRIHPTTKWQFKAAIESANPDGIVIDPLNDFATGDLNKDADMKTTLQTLSRICRTWKSTTSHNRFAPSLDWQGWRIKGRPDSTAPVSPAIQKRFMPGLVAQINLAPVDADNNDRLIVACGKCSNGREFPAFGVRLNTETMIYECDPTIDVSAWQSEMTGKSETLDLSPDMVAGVVAELGKASGAPKKPQIVKAIRDEYGCATV